MVQLNHDSTEESAKNLDAADPLSFLRAQFHIPLKEDLDSARLRDPNSVSDLPCKSADLIECTYLCGNSLGLQPKLTSQYISDFLSTWRAKGVNGHFTAIENSNLPQWVDVDEVAAPMAALIGARPAEVAAMGTLTANLHLLMGSFYKPTKERYKLMLESKAFPSDRHLVESQLRVRGLDPADALIVVSPSNSARYTLQTEEILAEIEKHGDSIAVLLFPAVSYFTGQVFDIKTITAAAHARGILVGFDLAHAAGNVKMNLHDDGVDFAAWCTYKYLNSGPGGIAAIFVHEKHGQVDKSKGSADFRPRLAGWWGHDKETRFAMSPEFVPIPGAAGYQVSNPSVLDMTALQASLEVFGMTSIDALVQKSRKMTRFLQSALEALGRKRNVPAFEIITPNVPEQRGNMISIKVRSELVDRVAERLEMRHVIVDWRKPDVLRVAPTPLYNTFRDIWNFCQEFDQSIELAIQDVLRKQ